MFIEYNPIETLKGLDNLVSLKLLSLRKCKIHEIESFKNKERLAQIILAKNPILRDLRRARSKKKKYGRMTEEERKTAGVHPNVWDVAINCPAKILETLQSYTPWYFAPLVIFT